MGSERLQVEVVTPDGPFLREQADLVELPTAMGEIGVYPGHEPMIALLEAGELRLHADGGTRVWALAGGFVRVDASSVSVLALFVADETAAADIETACRRAEESLQYAGAATPEVRAAELAVLRAELGRLAARRRGRGVGRV